MRPFPRRRNPRARHTRASGCLLFPIADAPNFETACREALDEIARPWSENAKDDFESARPTTITEAVELPGSAFPELRAIDEEGQAGLGTVLYHSGLDPLPIPAEFAEGDREDEKVGFS